MPQTLLLTVKSYEIDAGTNTGSPMGLMIRVVTKEGENLRLYFFSPDADTPTLVGWRAHFDGALVLFMQRRDYSSYVLLLDQAKASYIKVTLEDNENISLFLLSTAPFPTAPRNRQISETDAAEHKKRSKKS